MAQDTVLGFDDLVRQQSLPTEEKQPQAELQPKAETETPASATETQAEVAKEAVSIDPELLANETNMAMAVIDFTQQNLFRVPINYKRKKKLKSVLGENAADKVELLPAKPVEELTEAEKLALKIESQCQNVITKLPFSDDEKKLFQPILENYIKANRGKLPENFFVYIGILQAFGGRILNVLTL